MNLHAGVVQKQASLTEQILVIDLLNRLEPKKDRRRNSSKGIVDFNLCNDENAVLLTEGRCKIEGVSVMGFSQPRVDATKNDTFRSVVASLTENITLNFALETHFGNPGSNIPSEFSLQRSWALPLQLAPSSSGDSGSGMQSDSAVLAVIERFLIYDVALQQSRLHLQEAFKFLMLGDDEQKKGPKSISQVRKERESNLSPRLGDSSSANATAYTSKFLHSVDSLDHILGNIQDRGRQLVSLGVSASCYGLPVSLSDLTRLLNTERKVAVLAVWTCRWHGKIRTGVHFTRNVSPIPSTRDETVPISPRNAPSNSSSSLLKHTEDLLVSLSHPGSVPLPPGRRGVLVPVSVQLWNTGPVPVYVTVAPDMAVAPTMSLSRSQDSVGTLASSLASLTVKVKDSDGTSASQSRRQDSLIWQGKTKHVGLEVAPYAKLQVSFSAKFTNVGIFDLQR